MPKQIGYVIGSLRKDSWNRKLANALIRLGPPDFNFKELRIGDLPLYDQDDDRSQAPEVQRLKSELRAVDAVKRGELWFQFVDGLRMHVAVFHAMKHENDAVETEEAIPLWTPIEGIPFDEMWADDRHWLHRMLTGRENFLGKFVFEGDTMHWHDIAWSNHAGN